MPARSCKSSAVRCVSRPMPVTAHGIFGREPDRGKVMSAGGNVALAREFTLGKIPVGLSASLSANLNSTGDLGFVMPNYTFATPVLARIIHGGVGFLDVSGG